MFGSFGQVGQQASSNDCTFQFGKVMDAPVKVSWFLVLMFVFQLFQAFQSVRGWSNAGAWWYPIFYAALSQIILIATVLCHECGHGWMSRKLGGTISQILLWPFGGICFSTRDPRVIDGRQKVKNELKIVVAGPATHFFQGPIWVLYLTALKNLWGLQVYESLWWLCVPLANTAGLNYPGGIGENFGKLLLWQLGVWGVTVNLYLFLFNVFFPMYPMDSAKILVCSLQLCGARAVTAAKTLVYVSVPMAFFLIYRGFAGQGSGGQGFMQGLTVYMAIMCLMEAYKIHSLIKKRQLHTHYLFELARSDMMYDRDGARRFNTSTLDDAPDLERGRGNNRGRANNYQLFHGDGNSLGNGIERSPPQEANRSASAPSRTNNTTTANNNNSTNNSNNNTAFPAVNGIVPSAPPQQNLIRTPETSSVARSAFLERLEQKQAEKSKSVKELTEKDEQK